MGRPGLVGDEGREAGGPGGERRPDHGIAEASLRLLDQGEHRPRQAERREGDPGPVDAGHRVGVAALGDRVEGDRGRRRAYGEVDPEDPAPGELADQEPGERRPHHGGDAGPRGPRADGPPAPLAVEGRRDDRQRARDEQRAAQPLDGSGRDERLVAGRQGAERRGGAEAAETGEEHPPATELVGQRAAHEEQRDHRQQVRLHHPLLAGEARVQPARDRGQGDVHDRRVEEDDSRAENRGNQREPLAPAHHGSGGSRS